MRCPQCRSLENKVVDSRLNQTGELIRRRRECEQCATRFTTYERLEAEMPMVIKKDGRRETFSRDKIFSGFQKACQKRPITTEQIETMVTDIERKIESFNLPEISSRIVGQLAMEKLHELDKVAYIRFASVYREFQDLEDFVADIKTPVKNPPQDLKHN